MSSLLSYIPYPFKDSFPSSIEVLASQVPIKLVIFSHVPTVLIALAFAILLYKVTKKTSALYLLLIMITATIWSYLDLVIWTSDTNSIIFTWSISDIFFGLFSIFSFWFIYAFIKEKDLPLWMKIATMIPLVPVFFYTLADINMDTYFNPYFIARGDSYTGFYILGVSGLFLTLITGLTFIEYQKAIDVMRKRIILLAGSGVVLFMTFFLFPSLITETLLYFNIGTSGFAYNITLWVLFGLPVLVGVLSYLVAKYEAFDLKLVKSIQNIFFLMALLFVYIFI